ncbi:putative -dichlorophenoxyacetate alpha-ketoglutarate dioxygenase protein [Neofusicoccum parvum UCRNP2]|uniref:Putative-dichlorophenoxyacetate alpha-ketoglutarate dioxygenase protein n=1 Tax=Botryosphaeria parva (strain UCR-NP2) TaxID=1287680 RepID=R1GX78_BOTPV|nr:putative -dichlorophenoxyacetate alpha-ketoglutarate dioxygenase protein [Neofusicoccum parvum UCRNP2]
MPHKQHLEIVELHPTFGAEVRGVDLSQPLSDDVFAEIHAAITKYGVLVFRQTSLTDGGHVAFAARFGALDDVRPYTAAGKRHRLSTEQLFDVSNLQADGSVAPLDSHRHAMNRGNALFHVDSSFNARRAGYSLLRAAALPPPATGGATEFADTRQAFADLPEERRAELVGCDYVACHSLMHSRKTASPEFLKDVDPEAYPMSRHRLVQKHEPSGRWNLYVASHVHHVEGLEKEESEKLIKELYGHAIQPKYVLSVAWENEGDLVVWDNTCVMHRATPGEYEGKYARDMRRATVHDDSSQAWGLNERKDFRQGYP